MPPTDLSADAARRLALAAQGFARPRPKRVDVRQLRRLIRRLGLLQLDYVNAVLPAHYQVPFSRLGAYDRARLDDLFYRSGEFTEHWAHEASIVPMESWPLLRYRRQSYRVRPWGFDKFIDAYPDYVDRVLTEIRRRGPLAGDELPDPDPESLHMHDDWGWGMGVKKAILEAHFGHGRLAAADRKRNFQRRYDVVERVIPAPHRRRRINPNEARRRLLLQAARAHGVATASDLADYWRMSAREAGPRLKELVESGRLLAARVEGWKQSALVHPEAKLPRRVDAAALLSPFDPVVWTRSRAKRLFDFEYVVELFVPAAKRRWGYYVMPFLLGDRLAARVDLKADRKMRRLLVPSAYIERHARQDPGAEIVAAALAAELRQWADWLDLVDVKVGRKGNFARQLGVAVRRT